MPNSIAKIKKDGKEAIETTLDIKTLSKVNDTFYIVGDESDTTLLETNQSLQENVTYKMLKPRFLNDKLMDNPKFEILKSKSNIEAKNISDKEMKQYREMANSASTPDGTGKKEDMNNFTRCEALSETDKIEKLTLLIVSKSRAIQGKFGTYHIVTAKDCEGKKNSLNIYHDKTNIVQAEKLLTFTTLKKQNFKKETDEFNRLATIWNTKIWEANGQEKSVFHDVLLGDEKTQVKMLGYDNLNSYDSCEQCSTKLMEKFCKKCGKEVDEKYVWDYYVTLYVEDVNDEENIMEMFAFKKDLNLKVSEIKELEKTLDEHAGQTFTMEYNKPEDEGRYRLVKLHKE